MRPLILTALLSVWAVSAEAEGCPSDGVVAVPVVEALNQKMLKGDFSGFAAGVSKEIGRDFGDAFDALARIFSQSFDTCSTIAQRIDTGGMIQNVVTFKRGNDYLFAYWLISREGNRFQILNFNVNTDLVEVMSSLR